MFGVFQSSVVYAVEIIKVVDELEEKVGDVITSPVNEILPEKIELTGGQSGE